MVHLRIVVPYDRGEKVNAVLDSSPAVCNVIELPGAARSPSGDVILCDVTREQASVILAKLEELGIDDDGSIAIENIDTALSRAAVEAEKAIPGSSSDAVVWEEVEARTEESTELTFSYLLFMALATVIAAIGIFLNSQILIIGAMILGPEFGPLAGFCVAAIQKKRPLAVRSFVALLVGFPVGITAAFVAALLFNFADLVPAGFNSGNHALADVISKPTVLTSIVAFCAGIAGTLSLATSKSSVLVGVLVSVTTIPAAANIGISAAYADWATWRGSMGQLAINLSAIVLAGLLTLFIQHHIFLNRKRVAA